MTVLDNVRVSSASRSVKLYNDDEQHLSTTIDYSCLLLPGQLIQASHFCQLDDARLRQPARIATVE